MIDLKTRAVAHFFPDARTFHSIYKLLFKAEFEDTKGVIRIRILKKNWQHNGQKKKDKQRSIKHTINVQIKYMYCFLLHIFISFNPRTTHQTSQSQAMQVWTHLRPRSPLHISLDLLSALHLNHGHSILIILLFRNWTYHRIIFTCPIGQVGCRFYLPEDAFHFPRAIGQPLMSNPA